jgi:hypothetical protein
MSALRPVVQKVWQLIRAYYRLLFISVYILAVATSGAYANLYLIGSLLNPYVITQPYLIAHGFIPYNQIEDPRTPLLPQLLAWLQPFFAGNAPHTARMVHLVAVMVTIMLVLGWLYRVKGWWATIAGGIFFLAWFNAFGYWAISYYEIVLAPLFFVVFLLLMSIKEKRSAWYIILIGFLVAVGILIKQQTGILALLVVVWLMLPGSMPKEALPSRWSRIAFYVIGLFLPIVGYGLYYWHLGGDFGEWFYWNVTYIFSGPYRTQGALLPSLATVRGLLPALLLIVPYSVGMVFAPKDVGLSRSRRWWLLIFMLAASIFLYPRYSGRHWAAAFPFLAAIAGIVCADIVNAVHQSPSKFFLWGLSSTFIAWWFLQAVFIYGPQIIQPQQLVTSEYSTLIPLADTLRSRLPATRGLVLLPVDEGNANLYYQLNRLPPHYQMDFYPFFVNDRTSQKWLDAVEEEKPQTLIYFKDRFDLATYSPQILEYVKLHYEVLDTIPWEGSEVQIMIRRVGK